MIKGSVKTKSNKVGAMSQMAESIKGPMSEIGNEGPASEIGKQPSGISK